MNIEIIIKRSAEDNFSVEVHAEKTKASLILDTFAAAFGCILGKMEIPDDELAGLIAAAGCRTIDVARGRSCVVFEDREAQFMRALRGLGEKNA